ncbi:MAG: hypothetical protein EBS65_03610 [Betaproteobacteria bacterium]|nr:hypothetical protein [Betaproteobacteria bacterium]
MSVVSVAYEDGIAVITVSNPPVNTIDAAVRTGLSQAIGEIEARQGLKAVVLLCAGSTFFSGADIGEFAGPPKEEEYRNLFNRFEALTVPVVAAMHGTVMGGGLEIALACHYRAAAAGARFGLPEVTPFISSPATRGRCPRRRRRGKAPQNISELHDLEPADNAIAAYALRRCAPPPPRRGRRMR